MGDRFDGKVVLVTGAARGQGRSHAVGFAGEGADLVLLDICGQLDSVAYGMSSQADLDETAALVEREGRRALARTVDVRDGAGVRAAVADALELYGRIDVVVANAGIATYGMVWEMTDEEWEELIGVDLTGVWQTVKAAIPQMIERGEGGVILATSSCAGLKGFGGAGAYSAAKHGVVGLIRSLAIDLAPHSIRANVICPFSVETGMILNEPTYELMTGGVNPTYEASRDAFQAMVLLPAPWAQPRDVTEAYLFLASDAARYITGLALPVDLGFMTR